MLCGFTGCFFARWTTSFFILLGLFVSLSFAQSFNVTVDDQFGPTPKVGGVLVYNGNWQNMGFGLNGLQKGDPNVAGFEDTINGTWKRSTHSDRDPGPPTATLTFRGTAVADSAMVFELDKVFTNFDKPALAAKPGQITTVFYKDGLSRGEHTLKIFNGRVPGVQSPFNFTALFLDAVTYTTDQALLNGENIPTPSQQVKPSSTSTARDEPTPSKLPTSESPTESQTSSRLKPNQIAIIVGGIFAVIVALLTTFVAVRLCKRRRKEPSFVAMNFDRFHPSRPQSVLSDAEVGRVTPYPLVKSVDYASSHYGQMSYDRDQKY
ncbi:hypothetical protein ONZ45_g2809 [Pleurotus djamor]|nr:hypothetical protein ONZ45_g2809 [Pleurotus djamor]